MLFVVVGTFSEERMDGWMKGWMDEWMGKGRYTDKLIVVGFLSASRQSNRETARYLWHAFTLHFSRFNVRRNTASSTIDFHIVVCDDIE